MADISILFGGHLAYLLCVFSVFLSDIMSDVLREDVGHGVQNVGHVRMSDYFSYTLSYYINTISTMLLPPISLKKTSTSIITELQREKLKNINLAVGLNASRKHMCLMGTGGKSAKPNP